MMRLKSSRQLRGREKYLASGLKKMFNKFQLWTDRRDMIYRSHTLILATKCYGLSNYF
jgi:hypothetical protein